MKKFDSRKGLNDLDIVSMARKLLDATVRSSEILTQRDLSGDRLKETQIVLGFLRATIAATNTKIKIFKLNDVKEKTEAVSKLSKMKK